MTMNILISVLLIIVFSVIALIHVYWAAGGQSGWCAAIPEIDGTPAFIPSTGATLIVASCLAGCALLVAAIAGLMPLPLPQQVLAWLARALSLVLFLRAMGDFRLVGFFKRIRSSRFAYLDTAIYSPLCLLLATGVFFVS